MAQKTYMLELNFDSQISKSDMPDYVKQFADSMSREQEVEDIIVKLQSVGYAELIVDSSGYSKNKLDVFFNLGDKYVWEKLKFSTSEWKMLQNLKQESLDFDNRDFNYVELLALQKDIVMRFENSGYPFANTKLVNIEISSNKISAELLIDKGSLVFIDTIHLTDFDEIRLGFIEQYIGISIGDEYNESKIGMIEKLINRLDFIELYKPLRVKFIEGKAEVFISLKKKENNQFNGKVGMATNPQTKKLQFSGNLNLKLINSFSMGERISVQWESPGNSSQFLEINLQYPYLFNSPFGVALDFKIDKQDTTYVNLEYKPSLQFAILGQDYISSYVHVLNSNYLQPEDIGARNSSLSDVNSHSFGLGIYINRLDNIFNPRSGFVFNVNADGGYKQIIDYSSGTETEIDEIVFRAKGNAQFFIPLFRRQTIKIENSTAYIESENIMINELYKVGGFKTFRGFDEQSIFATFYSIQTLEYRLLLDQYSYLGAFYDIGQIVNPYSITTTGVYQSFGLTFSFSTKAGVFGLSYAIGKNEDTSFEFAKAKIHFGYMVVF